MEVDECEETTLHDVNIEDEARRRAVAQHQEAYDEYEEDMHGGPQTRDVVWVMKVTYCLFFLL